MTRNTKLFGKFTKSLVFRVMLVMDQNCLMGHMGRSWSSHAGDSYISQLISRLF